MTHPAEAARRLDLERQAELRGLVHSIRAWPLSCLGSTANEIEEAIAGYEQTDVPSGPDLPPHYHAVAASAKVRALERLREMLATRVEWEAKQVRLAEPEPSEPPEPIVFQAEAEPVASDAVVLRDVAHLLERGGEPYAWIPNRLRTIADRLEALECGPQPATVMRVRFQKRGGHYHCRVFTARQPGQTFVKNGDLVFDEAEWPDIPLLMRGAEFVEEVSERP